MNRGIWESILQKIIRVPTPENTQPWMYKINGENLEVHIIEERASHLFDSHKHALCISLGCLLEYINVAASSLEHMVRVENPDLIFAPEKPCLILSLRAYPGLESKLMDQLSSRSTNRYPYTRKEISDSLKEDLRKVIEDFSDLTISVSPTLSKPFIKLLTRLEGEFWTYPEYIKNLLNNIHFSRTILNEHGTGMFRTELGLPFSETLPLMAAKRFPFLQGLFPLLGMKHFISAHNRKLFQCSHFTFIGANVPGKDSLLRVGQAGMRIWLILDKHRFAAHPMTALTLHVFELNSGQLPEFLKHSHKNLIEKTSTYFYKELGMRYPGWALRFGQATSGTTTQPSIRPVLSSERFDPHN